MQGLYLMIITDNKVTVMGRKQLLGEMTIMLMIIIIKKTMTKDII